LADNNWKIASQQLLPNWVVESEHAFNAMIDEEFKLN